VSEIAYRSISKDGRRIVKSTTNLPPDKNPMAKVWEKNMRDRGNIYIFLWEFNVAISGKWDN